jgi:hypothetical protein
MNKLWKIEPELVSVALGVRALDFAQLALKARVHYRICFSRIDAADIAVVLVIQKREERWKRIAVLEAKPAAVTDLECALYFLIERACVPIRFFRRIV